MYTSPLRPGRSPDRRRIDAVDTCPLVSGKMLTPEEFEHLQRVLRTESGLAMPADHRFTRTPPQHFPNSVPVALPPHLAYRALFASPGQRLPPPRLPLLIRHVVPPGPEMNPLSLQPPTVIPPGPDMNQLLLQSGTVVPLGPEMMPPPLPRPVGTFIPRQPGVIPPLLHEQQSTSLGPHADNQPVRQTALPVEMPPKKKQATDRHRTLVECKQSQRRPTTAVSLATSSSSLLIVVPTYNVMKAVGTVVVIQVCCSQSIISRCSCAQATNNSKPKFKSVPHHKTKYIQSNPVSSPLLVHRQIVARGEVAS